MWRRLRRRSMAPRRPAVFPGQWGLVIVTGVLLVGSVVFVLVVVWR